MTCGGGCSPRPTSTGRCSAAATAASSRSPSRSARARARRTRASTGSSARTAPTRSCSPTPRSTRSTSRCRTRCTCRGRSGRSRRASTCCARSRCRGTRPTSSAAFDVAERAGRVLTEAFMWRHHPQTARARASSSPTGAIGAAAGGPRVRSPSPTADPGDVRLLRATSTAAALMDVGCYCVSGCALARGRRARARRTPSRSIGGDGRRRARSPARCASPATCSRTFDCGCRYAAPRRARGVGEDGSLFLDDPWHGRDPGHRAPPPGAPTERIEVAVGQPVRARDRGPRGAQRAARPPPLLGRDDALGPGPRDRGALPLGGRGAPGRPGLRDLTLTITTER